MGNAVIKKERMQKRAQQAGRISMIANVFLSATKKGTVPTTGALDLGFGTRQAETSSRPNVLSWMRRFQKKHRSTDEEEETPTLSYSEQRSNRQAERLKLAREEARYGTAPANLDYESMLESEFDVTCMLCNMVKNDIIHECRICGKCYHQTCLEAGGYCNNINFTTALKNSEEDVGWSCSDCESLGSLLTMEEIDEIMHKFDTYDKNGDSKISWADYRAVEKSSGTESSAKEKFFLYDADGDGIVSWEDYLLMEAIDVLEKQPQVQLIMYLTPKEIERIKNCFRMKDDHNTGVISVVAAAEAYYSWLKAQGLESSEEGRVVQEQIYMYNTSNKKKLESSEEGRAVQEQIYNTSNKKKMITWERFIRQRALAILSARPNTATIPPYIRGHPSTAL